MSELIYLDKVTEIINKFLAPFDVTAEVGTDFEYLYQDDLIHFAFVVGDANSEYFMDDVARRFPSVHADIFLWSIFHELGHAETFDELSDVEYAESQYIKERVVPALDNPRTKFNSYALAPDEKMATDWAGNYMMEHKDEVSAFWNELRPVLMEFYRLNGIER